MLYLFIHFDVVIAEHEYIYRCDVTLFVFLILFFSEPDVLVWTVGTANMSQAVRIYAK